ncbi:hypothetical protein C4J81_15460 [Deltaproteobacteria bacterium Smac51]|nr:hypothetical protein C4J81_10195 [Deltaproteobacteria bacterium Smac51]UQZ90528.1 hypothetical protein C4J81_15460 [Deltaproteobacteria bacterium Smac51]
MNGAVNQAAGLGASTLSPKGWPVIYHCQLYTAAGFDQNPESWQGPYVADTPEVAAAMWTRGEWDARHMEVIRVAVKNEAGEINVIDLKVRLVVQPVSTHYFGFIKA